MNFSNYKVIFKGNLKETGIDKLVLTFTNILTEESLQIPDNFIFDLKRLSENRANVITFQNIEEVIQIGNTTPFSVHNNYTVIIYTLKSGGKKEGLLVGSSKKRGDIIIGIWPFNDLPTNILNEALSNKLISLIKNEQEYSNICLIF